MSTSCVKCPTDVDIVAGTATDIDVLYGMRVSLARMGQDCQLTEATMIKVT
jgi:hypothetical protein